MAENCWVLTNANGVDLAGAVGIDGVPHFETRERATEVAKDYDGYAPRQLEEACTIVTCSCCEAECGEAEEGYTLHFFAVSDSPEGLGWVREGDAWRCGPCSIGDCEDCASSAVGA